jgi:hypothetical protein
MTGDTIRREDLIEWSGLPVGKTCALCGNGPGAGRVKWWKEADNRDRRGGYAARAMPT